jgi:PUA domain protein
VGGANVMIPGLTSKGGILPEVKAGSSVAIYLEGKQYPLAIGRTTMSKNEMIKVNKGIGIELIHYVGDDAWNSK